LVCRAKALDTTLFQRFPFPAGVPRLPPGADARSAHHGAADTADGVSSPEPKGGGEGQGTLARGRGHSTISNKLGIFASFAFG
jgi:hypothetical protein